MIGLYKFAWKNKYIVKLKQVFAFIYLQDPHSVKTHTLAIQA